MNQSQMIVSAIYLIKLPILATSILVGAGVRVGQVQIRWSALVAGAVLSIYLLILFRAMTPPDFHIFWRAGRDVWNGIDPYSEERFAINPFLNPPTALPLFAVFAILPFQPSFILWTILNIAIAALLPAYCVRVIAAQTRIAEESQACTILGVLSRSDLISLGAALVVSEAVIRGLYAGQFGLFTALALLAALEAQGRGRPILSGACLALATVKVVTMLPFLILFNRKADIPSWASLTVVTLALCLAAGRPADLPGQIVRMARRVDTLSSPGRVNDYSYLGPQNESIIGFNHLFYRLGLRDRPLIRSLQYLAVAGAGLWTAWQVWTPRLPRGAGCSLVALFSLLFLYHRDYDTTLLALPLVYCAQRVRAVSGAAHRIFACCVAAIGLVLYLHLPVLMFLTTKAQGWGIAGRLVQAGLLPYATWLILLVAVGLVLAESLPARVTVELSPP